MVKQITLDTNIAIDLLNDNKYTFEFLKNHIVCLPTVVVGELLFGAKNSDRKKTNLLKYRDFINSCHILTINKRVSEEYSDIRLILKEKGTPIPENDIWIAAACKATMFF